MHTDVPTHTLINKVSNKLEWESILNKIGKYDCYHTYDYHRINKKKHETPLLLCYQSGDVTIALPLVKRPIANTGYYDFTSVYGYVGPVFSNEATQRDFEAFKVALKLFCESEKIVSVFSRLNPYLDKQDLCLKGLGETISIGKLVYIDLSKSVEEQKTEFSSTCKRYINRTRRSCTIKKANSIKDIETFMDLYYKTMDRVNADPNYYFEKDYFLNLFHSKEFTTEILFAVLNDTQEIISGILTFRINNIIHYHLSGTLTEHLNMSPLRLLIDEVRIRADRKESAYLNLGGGLGSQEDSLHFFKASFSKQIKGFQIWKYIVNKEVYNSLVLDTAENNTFFPAYREKNL